MLRSVLARALYIPASSRQGYLYSSIPREESADQVLVPSAFSIGPRQHNARATMEIQSAAKHPLNDSNASKGQQDNNSLL